MIPLLGPRDPFPPVHQALGDPNGLLAAGGGLGVARLIDAYRRGIFPWFSEGDPILWWCPDPRMVLDSAGVHVSRSLRRRLRKGDFSVTCDRAFDEVIHACAAPRRNAPGTWLVPPVIRAYQRLHAAGLAHSIEVWMEGRLAGGLYGVALGRMFFGESMFTRRADASKLGLVLLAAQLARWQMPLIDCQMRTAHLLALGARDMPRWQFVATVERLVREEGPPAPWQLDADLSGTSAPPARRAPHG